MNEKDIKEHFLYVLGEQNENARMKNVLNAFFSNGGNVYQKTKGNLTLERKEMCVRMAKVFAKTEKALGDDSTYAYYTRTLDEIFNESEMHNSFVDFWKLVGN